MKLYGYKLLIDLLLKRAVEDLFGSQNCNDFDIVSDFNGNAEKNWEDDELHVTHAIAGDKEDEPQLDWRKQQRKKIMKT